MIGKAAAWSLVGHERPFLGAVAMVRLRIRKRPFGQRVAYRPCSPEAEGECSPARAIDSHSYRTARIEPPDLIHMRNWALSRALGD